MSAPVQLYDATQLVIDRSYVVFTTSYGRHLLDGTKLPTELKGLVLLINAEPTLERITVFVDRRPVEVWLPKVIVRDTRYAKQLYSVVYDPQFLLPPGTSSSDLEDEPLVQLVHQRSNYYDPISRS